jgi:antitoxin VapB
MSQLQIAAQSCRLKIIPVKSPCGYLLARALREPKEYQFETDEVFIRKEGEDVILSPRPRDWRSYLKSAAASDGFMTDVEDLPSRNAKRNVALHARTRVRTS